MPLTLTARDKAYVRAVAHGGAHNMYRSAYNNFIGSASYGQFHLGTEHDRYVMLHLGRKPKSQVAKAWHILPGNSHELQDIDHDLSATLSNSHPLTMFDFSKSADTGTTTKLFSNRYGDNCFLESTNIRIRVCLPHARYNLDEHTMGRLIVFRSKEKQSHIAEESMDHANPHYDLFINNTGYEIGLNGYVNHQDAEDYVKDNGFRNSHSLAIQNYMVNKSKYVVMKDCKFNLGKDFGALAFETTMRWDWNDRCNEIPHDRLDIIGAQGGDAVNKNYDWYILAIGTNPSGSTATQLLNVEVMGTTHAKTTD